MPSPDENIRTLTSHVQDLEAQLESKKSTISDLESLVLQLRRASAEKIIDLSKNATEEQIYSLEKGIAERQEDLRRCRADVSKLDRENTSLRQSLTLCPRFADAELMCVKPHWRGRTPAADDRLCFLIMPFSQPWSDRVWLALERAVSSCALKSLRADQQHGRMVVEEIWKAICDARVVIADVTGGNPNVCYEMGLVDVLGKRLVLVSQTTESNRVPFDFLGQRLARYEDSDAGLTKLTNEVTARLKQYVQ